MLSTRLEGGPERHLRFGDAKLRLQGSDPLIHRPLDQRDWPVRVSLEHTVSHTAV